MRADWIAAHGPWWNADTRWGLVGVIVTGAALGFAQAASEFEISEYQTIPCLLVAMFAVPAAARAIELRCVMARWTPPNGATKVQIDEDALHVMRDGKTRFVPWDRILDIGIADAHVSFAPARPENKTVIPLRAFADSADMLAFFGAWEEWLHADEDGEARAEAPDEPGERSDDMPNQPRQVKVALRGQEWSAVRQAMSTGRPVTFAQSALFATVFGGVLSSGLAALVMGAMGRSLDLAAWAAFAWPGAILLAGLGGRVYDNAQRKMLDDGDTRTRNYEIIIDAAGVTRRAEGVFARLDWSTIASVERVGDTILLKTNWSEGFLAPRRAFENEQASDDFFAAAAAWRNEAARRA